MRECNDMLRFSNEISGYRAPTGVQYFDDDALFCGPVVYLNKDTAQDCDFIVVKAFYVIIGDLPGWHSIMFESTFHGGIKIIAGEGYAPSSCDLRFLMHTCYAYISSTFLDDKVNISLGHGPDVVEDLDESTRCKITFRDNSNLLEVFGRSSFSEEFGR